MEEGASEYDLCGTIIGLGMKVHSVLGPGFLESVYRNALAVELKRSEVSFESEKPITVRYEDEIVGSFTADLFVSEQIIIELQATLTIAKAHEVQLVNYLTATGIDDGLLLNFGAARFEFKRKYRRPKTAEVSF